MWVILLVVLVLGIGIIAYCRAAVSRKCPKCRKNELQKTSVETVTTNSQLIEDTTYVCRKCRHIVRKQIVIADVAEPGEKGFSED